MKHLFLVVISLIATLTCALPPGAVAQQGSPPTTMYDGAYVGSFVQITNPGGTTAQCPKYNVAPALTIRNGTARFAALDLTFQGSVTPQGQLSMRSEGGQTFEGQFYPNDVLKGRVTGRCVYDATWEKYKKRP